MTSMSGGVGVTAAAGSRTEQHAATHLLVTHRPLHSLTGMHQAPAQACPPRLDCRLLCCCKPALPQRQHCLASTLPAWLDFPATTPNTCTL
jgi:hypothetical protein